MVNKITCLSPRTDAKSQRSHLGALVFVFLCVFLSAQTATCWAKISFSRQDLLEIGLKCEQTISMEFTSRENIPTELARPPGSQWLPIIKSRRRRKCRGDRGGPINRLKRNPHRPAIPSLFLSNVRSLETKWTNYGSE